MHLCSALFTVVDGVLDHREMTNDKDALLEDFFDAAVKGDVERLQTLLPDRRIDINAKNQWGRTAIQVFKCSRPDVAETLLQHGADPNVQDRHFQDQHLSTFRTPAHDVAEQGFTETIRTLLKYGADVNLRDRRGFSPAHTAAENGRLETMEYLSGVVDLKNCQANDGSTPLDLIPITIKLTDRQREWIDLENYAKPKSLKYLARLRIRHYMRHKLKRLHEDTVLLPHPIKKYILLQD